MTDHSELKRLAEAATPGPWYQHGGIMQVLSHDCETVCETFEDDGECPDAQFIAAANPAVVLGLIAHLDLAVEARDLYMADKKQLAFALNDARAEAARLKAENERLERNRDMWKGQVERQTEELTTLRGEVAEWKETVKFNEKCWSEERGAMIDKLQESRMRIKELDLLFGRYILAMRSALIEEEHGKGPAAAMEWIYNSLAGPGELPPEGETDSQAYFDREIVAVDNGMQEVMAFHEGRCAALGQGEQS